MEANLRPLTLGEILDRTAQLYRTNFLLFAGIAAVYAAIGMLLNLIIVLPVAKSMASDPSHLWGSLSALGVVYLILFLIYGATVAASTRAVAWLHLGEPATIRDAYTSTLPRLGRYLWLKVIVTFMMFLAALAAGLVFGVPAAILGVVLGSSGVSSAVVSVLFVLLAYIGVGFFVIWVALRYSLAIPASVMENLKARPAIRRSVQLSKGSRGRIFVLWLLVAVIWIVLFLLTNGSFLAYAAVSKHSIPLGFSILQQFLDALVNTFAVPISAIGATLFYYDQRIRLEGFDIEWMMKAAGLTVPAPAAEQTVSTDPVTLIEPPQLAPQEPKEAHE